jgi:hypothetical protein
MLYRLTLLAPNGLDRDSENYQQQHYRAHWQPLCAIFGLFACTVVVLFSGWSAIYLLRARDTLSTVDSLIDSGSLAGDVIGAYSGVSLQNRCFNNLILQSRASLRILTNFITSRYFSLLSSSDIKSYTVRSSGDSETLRTNTSCPNLMMNHQEAGEASGERS